MFCYHLVMKNKEEFSFGIRHLAYNAELRKRRLEMGLTQEELGILCGLGKSTISHIEGFRNWPNDEQKRAISKYLGVQEKTIFPEWMEQFKVKRSSFSTEHIITERLLPNIIKTLSIPSQIDDTEEKIDRQFMKEAVKDILGSLSDRERKVVEMRFGLDEKGERTMEEVGKQFGVGRERIRQIEAKALRKLRHPYQRANLQEFIK